MLADLGAIIVVFVLSFLLLFLLFLLLSFLAFLLLVPAVVCFFLRFSRDVTIHL